VIQFFFLIHFFFLLCRESRECGKITNLTFNFFRFADSPVRSRCIAIDFSISVATPTPLLGGDTAPPPPECGKMEVVVLEVERLISAMDVLRNPDILSPRPLGYWFLFLGSVGKSIM